MSESNNDDRPATRDDIIYAVAVIIAVMMLCSATDTCNRRLQINKLREDLQQQVKPPARELLVELDGEGE